MNYIDSLKSELSAEAKKEQEKQNQIRAAEAQHIYEREFSTVFIEQYVKPKIKECMRNNQTSYSGVLTSHESSEHGTYYRLENSSYFKLKKSDGVTQRHPAYSILNMPLSYCIDNDFLCAHLQSELLELGLKRCKVKFVTHQSYTKYSKDVTNHYVLYIDIKW